MSDSELSDAPFDLFDDDQLTLPTLPPLPTHITALTTVTGATCTPLLVLTSRLFTKDLYTRTILETTPVTMRVICTQPNCGYSPRPQVLSKNIGSNLWKHYNQRHPAVGTAIKQSDNLPTVLSSSAASVASTFFEPRKPKQAIQNISASRHRDLVLSFIISNNLSLRLVESYSFRQMIQHLSPSTLSVSTRTLHRDLQRQFSHYRAMLHNELQQHISSGGRISLTTDTWSTRNDADYSAITAH